MEFFLTLLQVAPAAVTYTQLPGWLAGPCLLASALGAVGLFYCIRGFIRLADSDVCAFPAGQASARFQLPKAGDYTIGCAREGQYNKYFSNPPATFRLRQLATGQEQVLPATKWLAMKKTDMSGVTTQAIANFSITEPGEYELRNPDAGLFRPTDRLRIGPASGLLTFFLILGTLLSAFGLVGGFIVGLIAARDGLA